MHCNPFGVQGMPCDSFCICWLRRGSGCWWQRPRHAAVLAQILSELPELRGKLVHDLYTAVLMREHGLSRICTRDADFRRFPFLPVVDPLVES